MSKIFKAQEARKSTNPGVNDMYWLVDKDLGATRIMAVLYEYQPNFITKRVHYHERRESAYFILEGEAKIHLNGMEHILQPGDVAYLSPKDIHGVVGSGPKGLKMIEIWAPQEKDVIYLEDGKVVD
ncbi:MAG: cupin domain-containing protein [Candidatus Bathyarchaeia archaeon]|jgi:mannose-6-phosphate isomerase-like protein (cupin superfamily)